MTITCNKPYTKKPLSLIDQAKLLQSRGLTGDLNKLCHILKYLNYYRLSGFLSHFKTENSENFEPGTTVEKIWSVYTFDRRLRNFLFECIGRLEIAFRTQLVYEHAMFTGDPFCYTNRQNFSLNSPNDVECYNQMVARIRKAVNDRYDQSKAGNSLPMIKHFKETYTDQDVPIWLAIEVTEFGVLPVYFRLLPLPLKQKIAREYGATDRMFALWLTVIKNLRNKCAHHERLIFSQFPTKGIKRYCHANKNTILTDLEIALQDEDDSKSMSLYGIACILAHLLTIIRPESQWRSRFRDFMLDDESKEGRSFLKLFSENKWLTYKLWQ